MNVEMNNMIGIIGTFKGVPIYLCKCGCAPRIITTYDIQVVCDSCGLVGTKYFGDYYDEGFMMLQYGEQAIKEWNEMVKNENL